MNICKFDRNDNIVKATFIVCPICIDVVTHIRKDGDQAHIQLRMAPLRVSHGGRAHLIKFAHIAGIKNERSVICQYAVQRRFNPLLNIAIIYFPMPSERTGNQFKSRPFLIYFRSIRI